MAVLYFTHGEASTLEVSCGLAGEIRAGELSAAARVLGLSHVELVDLADGSLAEVPRLAVESPVMPTRPGTTQCSCGGSSSKATARCSVG